MIITKRDILKLVSKFCRKECLQESDNNCRMCSLGPIKTGEPENQCDLFKVSDSHLFFQIVLEAAESFRGDAFWWSELRAKVKNAPVVDNWWSVSTRTLMKNGFRIINSGRRSRFKSRCGAVERQWLKVNNIERGPDENIQ